jgi:hypothetical protein
MSTLDFAEMLKAVRILIAHRERDQRHLILLHEDFQVMYPHFNFLKVEIDEIDREFKQAIEKSSAVQNEYEDSLDAKPTPRRQ